MSCTIKVCGNDFNFKNGLANSPDEIRCCRLFSFHFIFVWWIIVSVEMGNECDAIIKLYVSLALIMPFKLLQNPNRSTEMVASCCTIGRKNSSEMNWVDAFGCMYYFKWKPPKHCSFIWYANYLCTRTHSQSVNWRVRYRHYPKSFIKWDKCHQHSLTHTHTLRFDCMMLLDFSSLSALNIVWKMCWKFRYFWLYSPPSSLASHHISDTNLN